MAVSSASTKKKKKNWYAIQAPKILKNAFLGESIVYNKEDLTGKSMTLNLSTIINDMKRQNINVSFKVKTVVDNKAITEITGMALTQAYVKRLIRRGRNKVDDSFTTKSKDGKMFRLKPLIVTSARTNRSVTSRIRVELRKILRKMLKSMNAEDFFNGLLIQKIQRELKEKLSKIYPLKYIDIRNALFVKEKPHMASKEEDEEPEVSDEELAKEAASNEEMEAASEKEKNAEEEEKEEAPEEEAKPKESDKSEKKE